jgi:hypothetical protein
VGKNLDTPKAAFGVQKLSQIIFNFKIGSTTNCVGKKFLPRITRIITNSINLKFELHEFKTSLGFVKLKHTVFRVN